MRPNWKEVYRDSAHTERNDDMLVLVTRETARLALSVLREQNRTDYYHNYGAAERELSSILEPPFITYTPFIADQNQ